MSRDKILNKIKKSGGDKGLSSDSKGSDDKVVKDNNDSSKASDTIVENLKGLLKGYLLPSSDEITGNWHDDRYRSTVVQRNIFILLFCFSLGLIFYGVFAVIKINSSRTLEPFVVEIDKKSGVTTALDLSSSRTYTGNEAVNSYFLTQYVRYRETYDPVAKNYNWHTVLRLWSSPFVYRQFLYLLRSDGQENPMVTYSNAADMDIKIRSLQFLTSNTVQIRFLVTATAKQGVLPSFNKVAIVEFKYEDVSLSQAQRYVNPLGFQVTSYKVTNELL